MKNVIIGSFSFYLIILGSIAAWFTGWPLMASVIASTMLWIASSTIGILLICEPRVIIHKMRQDWKYVFTLGIWILPGPMTLIFVTILSHPYFLYDKSVRDIMGR